MRRMGESGRPLSAFFLCKADMLVSLAQPHSRLRIQAAFDAAGQRPNPDPGLRRTSWFLRKCGISYSLRLSFSVNAFSYSTFHGTADELREVGLF